MTYYLVIIFVIIQIRQRQLGLKSMQQYLDYRTILKLAGIGGSLLVLYRSMNNIKKINKQISSMNKQAILTPKQAHNKEQGSYFFMKIKKKPSLLKQKCVYVSPLRYITYNQYYLHQPMDQTQIQLANNYISLFHERYLHNYKSIWNWQGKGTDGSTIKLTNFGLPVEDVYQIQYQKQLVQIGLIKKIYGAIAYYLSKPFPITDMHRHHDHVKQGPSPISNLIQGPIVAKLRYLLFLNPNIYFVLRCHIENGKVIPDLIAKSKFNIIQHIKLDVKLQWTIVGLSVLTILILLPSFQRDIKKIIRKIKNKFKKNQRLFQLENPINEKACIICYTNTRNLILSNCKHLILCHQCYESQNLPKNQCPICKAQIDQVKIIQQAKQ